MDRVQKNISFEELYREAEKSQPILQSTVDNYLDGLKSKNPGVMDSVTFGLGPVKTPEKALTKIEKDYGGDHTRIRDLSRGTIWVDNADQARIIQQSIAEGLTPAAEAKDNFSKPTSTGFRNINQPVVLPNEHIAEVQVHVRDMAAANKLTHDPYDRAEKIQMEAKHRELTDAERIEREACLEECRAIHGKAAAKAGLNDLLREDLKSDPKFVRPEWTGADAKAAKTVENNVLSLSQEFGKRAGIIGGVVVAGTLAASGASASEVALGTAEATVPGVSSVVALSEGRVSEAAIRGIEEIPIAGIVASEVVRPIARGLGMDVDPSLGQMLLTPTQAERSPELRTFDHVYDNLPTKVTDDMPPEVASLVEAKGAILRSEDKISEVTNSSGGIVDSSKLAQARATRDRAEELFSQQYDSLEQSQSMGIVAQWLDDKAAMASTIANNASSPIPAPANNQNIQRAGLTL